MLQPYLLDQTIYNTIEETNAQIFVCNLEILLLYNVIYKLYKIIGNSLTNLYSTRFYIRNRTKMNYYYHIILFKKIGSLDNKLLRKGFN